jgi:hypothetical protein
MKKFKQRLPSRSVRKSTRVSFSYTHNLGFREFSKIQVEYELTTERDLTPDELDAEIARLKPVTDKLYDKAYHEVQMKTARLTKAVRLRRKKEQVK